ncbi:glutamine amidotransferase [Sphingosinicella microcystinivorans]|uniref:glutamine amidotransferase n=1 Tax=Sphingosinicella microcystinivorans TaxID=335406 RepID=UPI0022F39B2C|nr:glutamine amidotransferase [Sphingosinicella microcystinivorans]WBX83948.1 glutamine amidotransferase [Sphingosinicella microcystinivorans]
MKSALIIRHVPYEGVAGFRKPIKDAGYVVDRIDVTDAAFSSVDLSAPDLVIMMGGPMGVYEAEQYPWISCQLRRLAWRLEADGPTLGVCFGAQMMAAALGARVYAGPVKEVGFKPVTISDAGASSPLRHVHDVSVLHWHGDTFDLPRGVDLLASSDAYAHQAFRRGPNLLALQFHAEMGEDPRFDAWIDEWPESVLEAGKDIEAMRREHDELGPVAVAAGRRMIEEWLEGLNG